MQLFFAEIQGDQTALLSESEAHHASRVLRLKVGDELHLTQGDGCLYAGELLAISKKSAQVGHLRLVEKQPAPPYLHVAIAPTKSNDRFEWFLEKATEIGISRISPLLCQNSERTHYKTDRGQRVIESAVKQSLSAYIPQLDEPIALSDLLQQDLRGKKLMAHCREGQHRSMADFQPEELMLLIGPEGDFTQGEIDSALELGFEELSLGTKRLRTETAALLATALFNHQAI